MPKGTPTQLLFPSSKPGFARYCELVLPTDYEDGRLASLNQPYSFEAFIVNHGARKGSSTEAEAVAEVLKERGLKATILTIKWAPNEEPSSRPNFESIARTKRYQALGSACRKSGISNLLLAHHADDQAETVMLRLIGGHRGKGLAAMASAGDIPECKGMYGVNKSGRPTLDHSLAPQKVAARKPYKPIALESGGVRIYRPLLGFEKRRLVATCLSMGIRWFEDATNSDVTLTQRNAARSLLTHERLPRAIQRDSLVQLSLVVRQTIQSAERMLHWFRRSIVFFDTRSGRLCMRFLVQQNSSNGSATTTTTPPITNQDIAFVINAVQIVSPMSHLELSKAASIVPRLIRPIKNTSNYAEIENTSGDALSGSTDTFSMCNVRFDRQVSRLVVKKASSETVDRAPVLDPHYVWILSRARFYRNVPCPIISIAPTISSASSPSSTSSSSSSSSSSIMVTDNTCPPSASQHQNEERGPRYRHHYQLWDGRFWISVRNHTLQTLVIRAYRESDAYPLRRSFSAPRSSASSFSSSSTSSSSSSSSSSTPSSSSTSNNIAAAADLHDFDTMISDAAPGPSRWTLPVIATEDSGRGSGNGSGEGRGGTVLAFPSLGYICPAGKDSDFGFKVRYRSVRLDPPLVGSK
ncbi:MAG: hypothetical protein M1825_000391 [Sarcosagium campestre]|nr:MAG: hypothetical protein M1825_000391 [Sarcosagium campestre]